MEGEGDVYSHAMILKRGSMHLRAPYFSNLLSNFFTLSSLWFQGELEEREKVRGIH